MDVTAMVDAELGGGKEPRGGGADGCYGDRSGPGGGLSPVDAFAWGSIVVGGPLDVSSEFERRLAAGAGIACRLRGALLSELGAPTRLPVVLCRQRSPAATGAGLRLMACE